MRWFYQNLHFFFGRKFVYGSYLQSRHRQLTRYAKLELKTEWYTVYTNYINGIKTFSDLNFFGGVRCGNSSLFYCLLIPHQLRLCPERVLKEFLSTIHKFQNTIILYLLKWPPGLKELKTILLSKVEPANGHSIKLWSATKIFFSIPRGHLT